MTIPYDAATISTPALITAMLDSGKGISDLIFSPGRPPQVETLGELTPVAIPNLPMLRPEDTVRIARDRQGRTVRTVTVRRYQVAASAARSRAPAKAAHAARAVKGRSAAVKARPVSVGSSRRAGRG